MVIAPFRRAPVKSHDHLKGQRMDGMNTTSMDRPFPRRMHRFPSFLDVKNTVLPSYVQYMYSRRVDEKRGRSLTPLICCDGDVVRHATSLRIFPERCFVAGRGGGVLVVADAHSVRLLPCLLACSLPPLLLDRPLHLAAAVRIVYFPVRNGGWIDSHSFSPSST